MSSHREARPEPIAIVGSACRFPGDAISPAKLWELLERPRDVLTEIPDSRFNSKAFYHPDGTHHGTTNVRHSYVLSDDHRLFDAQFFGTKPIEANSIDPQQRLLLETVYECLESAGIPMEKLQGSNTGVYVGLMTNDYADLLGRDVQNLPTYFASGTARSILSNRVSYFFDWHGPSMTIDTACSSSLVALHQAVTSLRNGESNVAVVAGTNLLLGPEQYIAESKLKMLSPTGRSRMWDKDADGYARGDGIAAVVLKTLNAALNDGDYIECIVRETGINQDGRTKGITMPNPIAQANLIHETYGRAGLDLSKPSDRPQYFEAHGTGTPAGDPVEAQAISTAFYGPKVNYRRTDASEAPLYVGSIKTVIGHTEGTAGLAAVMKASLALQHGVIPPNLLLNELNPAVRPFYDDLEILHRARAWPNLPAGTPRRASVNSFGFGGANAHAILESFEQSATQLGASDSSTAILTPFNFSANSERSLLASLEAYASYLKANPDVDLRSLSWTLNCRRSTLPFRLSLVGSSAMDLAANLNSAVLLPSDILSASQTSSARRPKLLGIFTGQGAQWARMGAELLLSSSLAANCVADLEFALQTLPEEDRPSWSLKDEILKDTQSSRTGEALFSQTLSTAVQVILVELLRAAGVEFTAVVGHSSGEIAAAYVAGCISARDAIRIAYYRGWSLQNARDCNGVKGAMMAVGTSLQDAQELCDMPSLEGRICVAASNSSASVTLSGDADAINEAKDIFEDEKKFVRLLKVDKAYHSHHMLPCAAPYIDAMQRCAITLQPRSDNKTAWVSSVYGKEINDVNDSLTDTYWSNNMINPVMFSQAVSHAVAAFGPFDMAVEVGPHPALKGPASQTIQEISGMSPPYTGTLYRDKSDSKSFASSLGTLWAHLGENAVDFAGFDRRATGDNQEPVLLKGLPSYSWDHDRVYWHESRISSTLRAGSGQFHSLLGMKCPDGTDKELRWRNYLHPREIPWLSHHQVQGQIVFPAAGYISAATECLVQHYGLESIQLIDFQDIIIGQALVLEDNSGVEVLFTLTVTEATQDSVTALYSCYSTGGKGVSSMLLHASAQIHILLGDPDPGALPSRNDIQHSFLHIDEGRFYDFVSELGFGYTGPFRALTGLTRKMDEATGRIIVPVDDGSDRPLVIHPGPLDAAIQSIMLAYSFPGDGRLRTIYLPTKINRIRINPSCIVGMAGPGTLLPFYASVADARFAELSGDVDIYSADGKHTVVQLQGLHTTPLSPLSSATDVPMFTEMTWLPEEPNGHTGRDWFSEDCTHSLHLERIAHFCLKNLHLSMSDPERSRAQPQHSHLLDYASHCTALVKSGDHPFAKQEWANDTHQTISEIFQRLPKNIDSEIMSSVGQSLPAIVRGETSILDILMQENMLSRFYAGTLGIKSYLNEMGRIAGQIGNRFPHINVLEIGAGAGVATDPILRELDADFASYTYTDFLDSWLDSAKEKFQSYQAKIAFKVLDIEKDVVEQGYGEGSYDLIVASLALYATENLPRTLSNIRRLLKPGGYLLTLEITDPNLMRFGVILAGLPGWWLGHQEGRTLSPFVSHQKWNAIMKEASFSGIDASILHDTDQLVPFSVMLTQAVDNRVKFLRGPLGTGHQRLDVESLTIIGGKTPHTSTMVADIKNAVGWHFEMIRCYPGLADIGPEELPFMGTVLSLTELDSPALLNTDPKILKGFQEIFRHSKNVLWVGHGALGENPAGNLFRGVQRTIAIEMRHLRIQSLNFSSIADAHPGLIGKKLLQLVATDLWEQRGELAGMLWYTEPELSFQDGKMLIPRLRLSSHRNDRYNSSKRLIVDTIDGNSSAVTISKAENYQVLETKTFTPPLISERIEVHVTNCLLRSVVITKTDYLFLIAGKEVNGNRYVIALAEHLTSRVHVPPSWIITRGDSVDQAVKSLLSIYVHVMAQSLLNQMIPGTALAVLEPDFSFAAALKHHAHKAGVQLAFFTTTSRPCSYPWIHVHRHSARRELSNKIPRNITRLFNLGGDGEVVLLLKRVLPAECKFENEQDLTRDFSEISSSLNVNQFASQMQVTWTRETQDHVPININRLPRLSLRNLIETQGDIPQSLITWDQSRLPAQVRPATKVVQFAKNKTYWLVGLTGGLGLSLCQWMANQGAQHIALSSRNPKVDETWILRMAAKGCTVRVFANDITHRASVQSTHRQIVESMPPIGGVAQGAMVLQDTMLLDLDLARFNAALQPKVQGSLLLDELFSEDSLDFMTFFSSMAALTGNPGQAAYNAANMFMASLAAHRKNRGLAGHAINIGAIVGNGYVTRELNMGQQSYLYKVGHNWMSEQDFHEIFAEGVLACMERTETADICSGLRIDDDDSKEWVSNPIFQHLVFKSNTPIEDDKKGKASILVKARLLEATSNVEVMEALQDAFTLKLQSALQLDPGKPVLDMSPDELGVDSLNAVDFRSYFMKELGIDVPVLKIFNAGSIRDLLSFVASCLPSSWVPNLTENDLGKSPQWQPPSHSTIPDGPSTLPSTLSDTESQENDEINAFHLEYIPSVNRASSTSSASIVAGDSSSDQDEDRSSLTSLDSDSKMPEKQRIERTVPMSFGQSRFWFLKSLVQNQSAFNVTPTFELKGGINAERLSHAVELVGQRHEALRTFFFTDENKRHMQGIWTKSSLRLDHVFVTDKVEVDAAKHRMKSHLFNLAEGEVMRIQLLTLTPDHHWILFGFHHINMDGFSFENLWLELDESYRGISSSHHALQYPDFTTRQLREYEEGAWLEDLEYWKSEFAILPEPIPLLPFSLQPARPAISSYATYRAQLRLGIELSNEVENCCRMFKVAPFHFHLAMWQILLHRHLNIQSVCIGLADGNRADVDILRSVGMFLNLLPMRFSLDSSQSFGDALKEAKRVAQETLSHSRVPFDVILAELNVPRSASHSPLFQAFYNYRPRTETSRHFCGCQAEGTLLTTGETSNDLQLDVVNFSNGDTLIHLLVQQDLYSLEHAEILLRSYENLVQAFTRNPATKVSWPPLFSETDIEHAITTGRGPEVQIPWSSTLVHRIDDMVELFPTHVAVRELNGTQLTYAQLQERVAKISNKLLGRGVSPGTRVGVFQTASINWICSLLAIWRIGAVYLPLDGKIGIERLSLIVAESKPAVILTNSTTASDFILLGSSATALNISDLATSSETLPPNLASPSHTAIIIYTSGSTGVPKGISLSHSSHLYQIQASSQTLKFPLGRETVLHQSSYAWDMSIYQILISLCNAATLIVAPNVTRGDPVAITDLIESEKVTTVLATPTEYLAWLRHGKSLLQRSSLALAISGGEPLTTGLLKEFQSLGKTDLRLINIYGPAEVTIACSMEEIAYMELTSDSIDPCLGLSTLPNYSVCIIDEHMQPLPIGIPGEVLVGGAGIAEGYLDPSLTKDSFLPDRYASPYFKSQGWTTVHRTGDRGRLTQNGRLILLGRIKGDNQIKLGGIRINVEEIEATIVQCSAGAISQAIFSLRGGSEHHEGGSFLVAFVILTNIETTEADSCLLRELPASLPLPQYMQPAVVVPIAAFPQNASGKVDRLAVSKISISQPVPPMLANGDLTPIEQSLRTLWQEVIPQDILRLHSIDSQSDFFHVGGSSLSLVDLQAHVKDRFGVSVPLHQLFEASNLQGMASRIRNISSEQDSSSVDWDEELEGLLADVSIISHAEMPDAPSRTGAVVLTGATGFIGKEILRRLVNDDRVHVIYCLAVRKPLAKLPVIFANPKVHVYHGDLGSSRLGLSHSDASSILQSADIVIHNGADVSFMKSYQSLKLTNVASTAELVKLALPRRIPFHFISTASVTRFASAESFGEVSVASFRPPAIPQDGYATGKWVCEVFLERVCQAWGLPVWIHRPSSVTGSDAPELDLMSNVLRYCQATKKIPASEAWSGVFDFISVESAAAQIIETLHASGAAPTTSEGARFLYQSGEIQVGQHEVQSMMEAGAGEQFETVPLMEWVDAAEAAGMNALLGEYLRQAADGQILLPRLLKSGGNEPKAEAR
ncbi:polyketide synthase/peptide synthetase [Penicillium brasilianum]|uniref:Polyketide synthase/peptide synthetase n=1 Tax=Penicillium brasilianum TaxID=104259 RepID=A0A1S9RF24_PENBI|nr:polyketide synthase/peptide synthetase [Penicillium brasilianum]